MLGLLWRLIAGVICAVMCAPCGAFMGVLPAACYLCVVPVALCLKYLFGIDVDNYIPAMKGETFIALSIFLAKAGFVLGGVAGFAFGAFQRKGAAA
jgi:hypothetical protein